MIRINLAPPETRHRRRSFSLPVPSMNLGLLFGVLFALAAGGIGYFWWSLSAEETQIAGEVDRLNRRAAVAQGHAGPERRRQAPSWPRLSAGSACSRPDQGPGQTDHPARRLHRHRSTRPLDHEPRAEGVPAEAQRDGLLDRGGVRLHVQPEVVRQVQGRRDRRLPAGARQELESRDLRGHVQIRGLRWRSQPQIQSFIDGPKLPKVVARPGRPGGRRRARLLLPDLPHPGPHRGAGPAAEPGDVARYTQARAQVAEIERFRREIAELEKRLALLRDRLPSEKETPTLYRGGCPPPPSRSASACRSSSRASHGPRTSSARSRSS